MAPTHFRDDRNVRAWSYDQRIIEDYRKSNHTDRAGLEDKLHKVGAERQQQLYNTSILVVGSSTLAQMILSCLAGMGVGRLGVMDPAKAGESASFDFLSPPKPDQAHVPKVRAIGRALHALNGQAIIVDRYAPFNPGFAYEFSPDLIIDATNNPQSKQDVMAYCTGRSVGHLPFISAASDFSKGCVVSSWEKRDGRSTFATQDSSVFLHEEYTGNIQGVFSSSILAGIIAEEVRKWLFSYAPDDKPFPSGRPWVYNTSGKIRTGLASVLQEEPIRDYHNRRALVAGVGALGNFVALELALLGFGTIDLLDMDVAEDTNLARQILLREKVGQPKVYAVAERLKELRPVLDVQPIYGKAGEPSLLPERLRHQYATHFTLSEEEQARGVVLLAPAQLTARNYDIIFGCFDNKYARIWMNTFVAAYKVPYVDGGTGPHTGQAAFYVPGFTHCVDCQLNLESFPERHSCQVDPSTIIPNSIIGSAMVAESLWMLHARKKQEMFPGILHYAPFEEARLYFSKSGRCRSNHHC
ncbi:ThiF family adenylyltransferase [Candidatus Woesearchaeota archaeon]|nr:ThiF family adenylyltransferase [Candidatus Woesearchaeota archaeon]